jgi:hypothetical protein
MNQGRRARPPRLDPGAVIRLRLAVAGDGAALEELAELSGRAKARGPWIVAEVDGRLGAALPLAGGEPLTDPFRPTAEIRALLSLRARQLDLDEHVPRNSARLRRRRFRSTPVLADHSRLY